MLGVPHEGEEISARDLEEVLFRDLRRHDESFRTHTHTDKLLRVDTRGGVRTDFVKKHLPSLVRQVGESEVLARLPGVENKFVPACPEKMQS